MSIYLERNTRNTLASYYCTWTQYELKGSYYLTTHFVSRSFARVVASPWRFATFKISTTFSLFTARCRLVSQNATKQLHCTQNQTHSTYSHLIVSTLIFPFGTNEVQLQIIKPFSQCTQVEEAVQSKSDNRFHHQVASPLNFPYIRRSETGQWHQRACHLCMYVCMYFAGSSSAKWQTRRR